jgi:hypothetical protein
MYATPSLSELKAIAAELNIVPAGDKRSKQSWITAIEAALLSASMPELPSHAEQEVIAIAADMVMAVTTSVESITESVTTESITSEVGVTDYDDISETIANPELEPATPIDCGSKRGAVTVISALVIMVIVAIRAILIGGCAIARLAILFCSMFGKYNPDLDFWYQLQLRVKSPQLSYS